jgi:predicted Zn-dependent peptidase
MMYHQAAPTPADSNRFAAQPRVSLLSNGLTVVTRQRPDAEIVAFDLAARAGSRFETVAAPGASNFVQRMFTQGTPRRPDRDAVMRTVTARGGTLDVSNGWEFIDFVVAQAPEDFAIGLDLVTDLIANSTFEPDRVEHQRQLILSELALRRDNPSARAYDLLYSHLFEDHPLRFLPTGDAPGTEHIRRDQLLDFRADRVTPRASVLAVVGPYPHEQVIEMVRPTLGALPAGPEPIIAFVPPPTGVARDIQYALGRDQAMVLIGAPTGGIVHPDRYALWLLQSILGPSGGRLFYDIRDTRGLAYDTNIRLALTSDAGAIVAYAGTDPSNVEEVSELLYAHLARAREELMTRKELDNAVGFLVGGTIVGTEAGVAQAGQLARNTALGLPLDLAEVEAELRVVQPEDIQRVAQKYLTPSQLTRVVVAPGAKS